jgi:hypothetical protein
MLPYAWNFKTAAVAPINLKPNKNALYFSPKSSLLIPKKIINKFFS